ncbi:hypothetical protein EET67_19070 [Pseudaminobacter arsenicus]|uniref:DUF6644 domain-containing protein n=1 Tax=Borborobacter arsenicus TaxID=1851146 RepID=A0A432V299_9HYPH|nr:DUF6644 family protein [Pseudaminobacter arsenicus]RUM96266.1 hypothetical protein EET67_19070 [Pseudaminobacter arsenicus]
MVEFLALLQQLPPVQALKSSFFAYPVVNALHIVSIGTLWSSVLLMDLRILGAFSELPYKPFTRLLRRVALIAFCGAVLTGFSMFAIKATEYAAMPVFLAKMALILLAAANFLLFLRLGGKDGKGEDSRKIRIPAVLSIFLWSGVVLAGRFIGFL